MMIMMPLKIFEMSAHLGHVGVGDGELDGVTSAGTNMHTYHWHIGVGVAWARLTVGEEAVLESGGGGFPSCKSAS